MRLYTCVVGKSMAISRKALDAIGGFAAFRLVLAEDQAIGLAVKRAGFEVTLSSVVVRNVVVRRTVRRAIDRQIRWNQIRFSFSRKLYAAEILLNPLPLAIVAALLGAPPLLPLLIAVMRIAQIEILRQSTNAAVPLWAVPLLDAAKLGRNTELIEVAA